jgi:hypothetical protein
MVEIQVRSFIHPIHSFIHQWLYSPLLGPDPFFSFIIVFTQTVGLLGQVISQFQGHYLHAGQHRINAHTNVHASGNIYQFYRQRNNCLLTYEVVHVSTPTGHPQVLHVSHTQLLNCNTRIQIYIHMVQKRLLSMYIQFHELDNDSNKNHTCDETVKITIRLKLYLKLIFKNFISCDELHVCCCSRPRIASPDSSICCVNSLYCYHYVHFS